MIGVRPTSGGLALWCVRLEEADMRLQPSWAAGVLLSPQTDRDPSRRNLREDVQVSLSYHQLPKKLRLVRLEGEQVIPVTEFTIASARHDDVVLVRGFDSDV